MKFCRPLRVVALLVALLAGARGADAQLRISGQFDLLALAGSDDRGLNRNFRNDSPWNPVRGKLFAQHWVTEDIGVFGEILMDTRADVRLNGLYVVLNNLGDREWLNVRAGLAPSLIGNFGLRSTYFNSNPLIGVPLVWQHRSTLDPSGLLSASDLLRRRETDQIGLPIVYEACWNIQWEVLGEIGKWEYSLGVTPGSVSNPVASSFEDGIQTLARVGYVPTPALRLGLSGAIGPYIGGPYADPLAEATSYPGGPADYDQRLLGIDAEYALGRAQIFAEGYATEYEVPLVSEDLRAVGGYVEGRYDLHPEWQTALRVGSIRFSEIEIPGRAGSTTGWDDDVLRIESAITRRLAREVHLRVGWQHTEFLSGNAEAVDLLAAQLRAVF